MKKILLLVPIFAMGLALSAQDMYQAARSKVHFFSDAPLEKIEAVNTNAKSLLNLANKQVGVVIPIIDFKFRDPLMEEHFNENYMETNKYKTAKFQGVIQEELDPRKNGTYAVTAKGKLNVHGVEQERVMQGTLVVKDKVITLDAKFQIQLKDHQIKIPTVVSQSLAEVVDVDIQVVYEPKTEKSK